MNFSCHNLTQQNKEALVDNTNEIINAITHIIEMNYFDDQHGLRYQDFWVLIYALNGVNILDSRRMLQEYHFEDSDVTFEWIRKPSYPLILSIRVECMDNNGELIISKTASTVFKQEITEGLRTLFDNTHIWIKLPTIHELLDAEKPKFVATSSEDLWSIDPIFIIIISVCIFACIVIAFCSGRKVASRARTQSKALLNDVKQLPPINIKNALVIPIVIGQYDENPPEEDRRKVGGILRDLDGIDNDIKQVVELFRFRLNYDVFPEYDINKYIKQRWNKKEIDDLLEKQAQIFEDNVVEYAKNGKPIESDRSKCYDGLIVMISCHGIQGQIVSSDYKTINRQDIHRRFSEKGPKCRKVPRIFIFDCCSGSGDKALDWRPEPYEEVKEQQREIPLGPIEEDEQKYASEAKWYLGEKNPDFRLVQINAANPGFMAKMSIETGSYVITKITEKIKVNLRSNRLVLGEIIDLVEDELSDKQQMVPLFLNRTNKIKFYTNTNDRKKTATHSQIIVYSDANKQNANIELQDVAKRSGGARMRRLSKHGQTVSAESSEEEEEEIIYDVCQHAIGMYGNEDLMEEEIVVSETQLEQVIDVDIAYE